jgi:hypothetical protein
MTNKTFRKLLSANDVGKTGGHQAGILIPRSEVELLNFLPYLDPSIKNPSVWIQCTDENSNFWQFRYIYYNNKLHDKNGTRNEYRITHMTKYLRDIAAREGDSIELFSEGETLDYQIRLVHQPITNPAESSNPSRIKLRGWRRVH